MPSLKLITAIFFALFILSACGGGAAAGGGGSVSVNSDNNNSDNNSDNNNSDNNSDNNNSDNNSGSGTPAPCGIAETRVDGVCTPDPIVAYQACDDSVTGAAAFRTDEYYYSGDGVDDAKTPLASICAAAGYAQIKTLIDNGASNVKQAGEGQIIAVLDNRFNTTHDEFITDASKRTFESVYHPLTDTTYTSADTNSNGELDLLDAPTANCRQDADVIDPSFPACEEKHGTHVAGVAAARKGGNYSNDMHGVAYNAKIKAVNFVGVSLTTAQVVKAIEAGSGTNIVAMNNSWDGDMTACVQHNGTDYYYTRPQGKNVLEDDCSTRSNFGIVDAELDAWKAAADAGTIMVFANGNEGLNSETGMVDLFTDKALTAGNTEIAATDLFGADNANIAGYYGSYPTLYNDDVLETGRWLTVVAVDENAKIATFSNACGDAMRFCLAAPGVGIVSASGEDATNYLWEAQQGTSQAAPHVSGALAVIKGAFPNITPDNLTRLVLETATYIPLDNKKQDGTALADEEIDNRVVVTKADGSKRYINPVYGYGLLNLNAATTPSAKSSYVTASNNESIGALWADSKLMLSSHFGSNFNNVKLGIGDAYGRHFVVAPPKSSYAPVAVGLDDYMAGMLGDNVQSEKLGTLGDKAQANYSNSEQSWMNLEYTSGKATSKIAFQESYKIKPLSDSNMGATSILRANNIRPASNNIGMMDVDYELTQSLTLSSYAARGEYDTGFKFDELGTDFDVSYKKSTLNIGLGNLREHQQFLGTNTTGAYALREPSISQFTDVTYGHDVGKTGKFNLYANYIQYKTDVDMGYQDFASIDGLQADQYQIGFKGKNLLTDDDGLNVALITKLGVTDGALNQNTVMGYTADGDYNNVTQSYDLAVQERHQQFEVTYQGKLYQHADKVSALKDNRFFTTIRVDRNLNHVQGAGQTEIVSGVSARF